MDFQINPLSYRDVFTLPTQVAERIKVAGENHLRFIIWVFASKLTDFSVEEVAKELKITATSVSESVLFWQEAGILNIKGEAAAEITPKEKNVTKISQKAEELSKPTRNEAVKRATEDKTFATAIPEIQKKLSRTINSNELISFVWMHDSLGLPVEVILTLIEYCVSEDKANVRYMEKIANEWAVKDIDSLDKAEKMLKDKAMSKKAWSKVHRAFGIDSRKPSDKELIYCDRWVNEWGFSSAMLKCAYNACIDAKAKLSFAYINSILASWQQKGYKKPEDTVKPTEEKVPKSSKSSIDIDEFSAVLKTVKTRKE